MGGGGSIQLLRLHLDVRAKGISPIILLFLDDNVDGESQ